MRLPGNRALPGRRFFLPPSLPPRYNGRAMSVVPPSSAPARVGPIRGVALGDSIVADEWGVCHAAADGDYRNPGCLCPPQNAAGGLPAGSLRINTSFAGDDQIGVL